MYQTEKLLKEQGDKISGDEKEKVESGLASLKEALAGTDLEAIKNATESLVTASQGFAQRLYEQASAESATAGGAGASSSAPNDDEVVDAEIVDDQQTGS